MAWATISEVSDITGQTVDAPKLARAQAVVEIHAGRTPDADAAATARDLHWLKQAVCWQAAWQPLQPAFHARSGIKRVSQDGLTTEYNSQADISLAPLATRAIKNLSWMGSRTATLTDAWVPPAAFTNEASDSSHGWVPL
jgi:hypothetical protein